jgi:hypothetical protein
MRCECCNDQKPCNFDPTIDLWLCAECLEDEIGEMLLVPVATGELRRYEARHTNLPPL